MKRLAALAPLLGALAAPALAHAAAPPIAWPDPVRYPVHLDYVNPLPGPDGKPATLASLARAVIMASTRDQAYLAYERRDDLGGFVPAPIGKLALSSGGRDVLSPGTHTAQIPVFQQAAGGKVSSFTFTGSPPAGPTPPPDNRNGPGVTPPPPPSPGNTVSPANQGFGGRPNAAGTGGSPTTTSSSGTTTTTKKPAPTTTASTTASTTTTTPTTTTTSSGGGGGGSGGCSGGTCAAGSCGMSGLEIDSAPPGCVISLANAAPGDSVSELMTITNTSGSTYTLSLEALGANDNPLWQGLEMDVFDPSLGPSAPMPSLQYWLTGLHALTRLNPGQSVQYEIELYLPTTAGNADQNKSATITFEWKAAG